MKNIVGMSDKRGEENSWACEECGAQVNFGTFIWHHAVLKDPVRCSACLERQIAAKHQGKGTKQ